MFKIRIIINNIGGCFLVGSKVHSKYIYYAFYLVVQPSTNNDVAFGRWRATVK